MIGDDSMISRRFSQNVHSSLTIFANILVVMVVLYLIVRVVPLPMQVVLNRRNLFDHGFEWTEYEAIKSGVYLAGRLLKNLLSIRVHVAVHTYKTGSVKSEL